MSGPFGLGRELACSRQRIDAGPRSASGKSLGRVVGKSWKWLSSDYYRDVGQRSRMCPLLGNRGNRSLGAPLTHVEDSTYLGPREPIRAQRSHPDSINLDAGPSKLLALGSRITQAGPNSLLD